MRIRLLMIVGVLIAVIVLGVPYFSWAAIDDNTEDMRVDLEVTAYCGGYLQSATFTHETEYESMMQPAFLDYVGDYWSNMMTGSAVPGYPCLSVLIQDESDATTRMVWYEPYTYGTTLEFHCDDFIASHGDTLRFQVQIYYAQSVGSYDNWSEIVP